MAVSSQGVSSKRTPHYSLAMHIKLFKNMEKTGAGEGIRTLDPNLGKVVLYP